MAMTVAFHPTCKATLGLALIPFTEALIADHRDEHARNLLAKELEQAPRADIHALLALIDRRRGDLEAAAGHYGEVARLDPSNAEARRLSYILSPIGDALSRAVDHSIIDELAHTEGNVAAAVAIVPDFLPREQGVDLLQLVDHQRDSFSVAAVGYGHVRPTQRNNVQIDKPEVLAALDDWFLHALQRVHPSVNTHLGEVPFSLRHVELRLCAYPGGTYFHVHRDRPAPHVPDYSKRSDRTRRISFTYFFHPEPKRFAGGDLLLHDTDPEADVYWDHRYTRVVARPNTLVCFPSGFYHQVTAVQEESGDLLAGRLVVNGHLHETEPPD
jgi:Rps23 Pro-64 3,4-dihydroxylase Tpa1-like proline 4-hydroxylase